MASDTETNIAPFSKSEMLEEVKIMLFCQASQIAAALNSEAADKFIGFQVEDWDSAEWDDYLDLIDLSRFQITRQLEYAYDFAFQVGAYWFYDSDFGYHTSAFGRGATGSTFQGTVNPYHLPDSKARHVIEMAEAREFLDLTPMTLTIRQLCLLSGMSDPSVRNSLSKEGIPTEGKPVRVDNDDARKWLSGRRGFVPTRLSEISEQSMKRFREYLIEAYPAHEGARREMAERKLTAASLAPMISFDEAQVHSFIDGQPSIDIDFLKAIAGTLEFNVPDFVAKAVGDYLRSESTI